jgi:hypothetical protein
MVMLSMLVEHPVWNAVRSKVHRASKGLGNGLFGKLSIVMKVKFLINAGDGFYVLRHDADVVGDQHDRGSLLIEALQVRIDLVRSGSVNAGGL